MPTSVGVPEGAPANLTARVVDGGIALNCQPPEGEAPTGYRILRRYATDPAELMVLVEHTGSRRTRYIDHTTRPETEYVYRVQPVEPSGVGARSNYARVTTPPTPRWQG